MHSEEKGLCVAVIKKLNAKLNAKVAQLNVELAAIEAAEGGAVAMYVGNESCSNKRRRQA